VGRSSGARRGKKKPWIPVTQTEEYAAYMNSPKWFALRDATLKRDGHICRSCYLKGIARPATQVHHITYDSVFFENTRDLVSLCRSCHEAEHRDFSLRRRRPFWHENTASMLLQREARGRRVATAPASRRLRPFVQPAAKQLEGLARRPCADREDLRPEPGEPGLPESAAGAERRDDVRHATGGGTSFGAQHAHAAVGLPIPWPREEALPVSKF